MILKCDCKHAFQDRRYGKGNRVHNRCDGAGGKWRCTICTKQKDK